MLDPACILLDLNQIYTDVSTGETECICLPVENEKEQKDQREFLKSVMFQAQFENPEEGSYVTRILNYLNSIPVFSSLDFLNGKGRRIEHPLLRQRRKACSRA